MKNSSIPLSQIPLSPIPLSNSPTKTFHAYWSDSDMLDDCPRCGLNEVAFPASDSGI